MAAGVAAWTVSIRLLTTSNFGLVTANMSRQAATAGAQVNALNSKMGALQRTSKIASAAMTAFGVGAAVTMAVGIKGAADLQDAWAQTAVAMGVSTNTIANHFTRLAMNMSNATAQSVTNSMELLRTMAMSGLNDPAQLRALAMPIALYADTQYLGKNHVAFNDSAALAAKLAHQFGARDAASMSPILNTLFKISQDMPDSLSTAATQIGYYAQTYTAAGVSAPEILQLQATLDRLGYGSRQSGRGMQMALRYLQNPTKRMGIAQGELGIGGSAFINPRTGQFNVEGMITRLNAGYNAAIASGTVAAFNATLARAFPSNAVQIISALASNAGVAQRENVRKTLLRVPDLQVAQAQLLDTLNNQTKRLITNFQTLATMLGMPFISSLTRLTSNAADILGSVAGFLYNHQKLAAGIGIGLTGASIYAAAKLVSMGHMAFRAFSHIAGGSVGLSRYAEGGSTIGKAVGGMGIFSGIRAGVTALALNPISGAILRFGLRFIPIIGWVTLAAEAVKLFGEHSKDIGKALGFAVGWLVGHGGPMVRDAFIANWKTAISGVSAFLTGGGTAMLVNAWHTVWGALVAAVTGSIGALLNLRAGFQQGYDQGSGANVTIHAHYHAPAHADDASSRRHANEHARAIAGKVAEVMGGAARTGSRAAGSTIASMRMSAFETAGALS